MAKHFKLNKVIPQILESYSNGMTLREIAKLHNVAPGTVRSVLAANNVDLRKRGRRSTTSKVASFPSTKEN